MDTIKVVVNVIDVTILVRIALAPAPQIALPVNLRWPGKPMVNVMPQGGLVSLFIYNDF